MALKCYKCSATEDCATSGSNHGKEVECGENEKVCEKMYVDGNDGKQKYKKSH